MDDHPRSEPIAETRGNTSGHDHADCKSVAKAAQVRILHLPRTAPATQLKGGTPAESASSGSDGSLAPSALDEAGAQ